MSDNKCIICGATIGDNNHTGIGGGCMANVVLPAKRECFKEKKWLDLWVAKTQFIRGKFLTAFGDVKFRNEFRKSFYSSMQNADRISKKQMDVMMNWLNDAHVFGLNKELEEIKDNMFDKFVPEYECPDLFKERLEIHRKLYLSGRKDQKEAA